ncbi:MAG: hypothetical protein KBF93_13920 [Leptospiraceae bacterium]|nr:hypothetical protein [Leptospiraceae bacterium]
MHTDNGTIKDTMVSILGIELGKMQLNDEHYEMEKNIISHNPIGALGVHLW